VSWRWADVEAAVARVLTEIAIAEVPADQVPAELVAGLYEEGWSIAPTSVVLRRRS
jgi:hypothetical protein